MIEKLTTKVSINTQGEAIRFANECYEVAEEFAIGFGEYLDSLTAQDMGILSIKELLEIYKKTL
jgi:hypothetical protein